MLYISRCCGTFTIDNNAMKEQSKLHSINSIEFQQSITRELESVKDRVRHLIGDRNWPEEGRYKEAILSKAILSNLPQHISIGSGFIVKEIRTGSVYISKQHDLILYNNSVPPILTYGDFIVTTPNNVLGVIEVKSNLTPATFSKTFKKLEESLSGILTDFNTKFIGIFSFNFEGSFDSVGLTKALKGSKEIVNHISLGENTFIRYWKKEDGPLLDPQTITKKNFFNVYFLRHLSYSYFISNIIHRL